MPHIPEMAQQQGSTFVGSLARAARCVHIIMLALFSRIAHCERARLIWKLKHVNTCKYTSSCSLRIHIYGHSLNIQRKGGYNNMLDSVRLHVNPPREWTKRSAHSFATLPPLVQSYRVFFLFHLQTRGETRGVSIRLDSSALHSVFSLSFDLKMRQIIIIIIIIIMIMRWNKLFFIYLLIAGGLRGVKSTTILRGAVFNIFP